MSASQEISPTKNKQNARIQPTSQTPSLTCGQSASLCNVGRTNAPSLHVGSMKIRVPLDEPDPGSTNRAKWFAQTYQPLRQRPKVGRDSVLLSTRKKLRTTGMARSPQEYHHSKRSAPLQSGDMGEPRAAVHWSRTCLSSILWHLYANTPALHRGNVVNTHRKHPNQTQYPVKQGHCSASASKVGLPYWSCSYMSGLLAITGRALLVNKVVVFLDEQTSVNFSWTFLSSQSFQFSLDVHLFYMTTYGNRPGSGPKANISTHVSLRRLCRIWGARLEHLSTRTNAFVLRYAYAFPFACSNLSLCKVACDSTSTCMDPQDMRWNSSTASGTCNFLDPEPNASHAYIYTSSSDNVQLPIAEKCCCQHSGMCEFHMARTGINTFFHHRYKASIHRFFPMIRSLDTRCRVNGVLLSNFAAGRFRAGFLKLCWPTTATSCFRFSCSGRRALPKWPANSGHAVCPCQGDDKAHRANTTPELIWRSVGLYIAALWGISLERCSTRSFNRNVLWCICWVSRNQARTGQNSKNKKHLFPLAFLFEW